MPLYSAELESIKKELVDLRRYSNFYGYEGEELTVAEYAKQNYVLSGKVKAYLEHFKQQQWQDIASFLRSSDISDYEMLESTSEQNSQENAEEIEEDNYFNAPEIELLFDQIKLGSYHDKTVFSDLLLDETCPNIVKDLDKIFSFEIERMKGYKSNINNVVLIKKISRVQERIRSQKINEASVLMSRFYNESKKDITLGYLYFELLYAKAGLGHQKSLAKARDIANTVCFLTDKSDEQLVSYYRYLYVCREFVYDKDRALQLFREFVLLDPEKMFSANSLIKRNGFYLRCLMLFLRFDIKNWNPYEIESIHTISLKAVAGGVFYLEFIRKHLIKALDSVRFNEYRVIEMHLYNIKESHKKLIQKIYSGFDRKGLPKSGSSKIGTVGQEYLRNFFLAVKLPSFSEYLVNTALLGVQYIESTKNDDHLVSIGMGDHSLWRAWVSKITSETSLQRSDIIPVEHVLKEASLLSKYENIIDRAYDYEMEIFNKEEYVTVRNLLSEVTTSGVMKIILGQNKYSVFDYGESWPALKDYYNRLKAINAGERCQTSSDLLVQKGRAGLFWNLEELQMMLDSVNLMIDNKNIGLKARLENILNMKDDYHPADQYMTLSEHLEMYWWMYILLISLLIFFFNVIL